MDESAPTSIEPVSTTAGPARVERALEVRELGVIATFSVTTSGGAAVRVSVVDYLPGNLQVDEIGFHRDVRPPEGTATREVVRFDVTASPGEETVVAYGATLASTLSADGIERAQSFSQPRIVAVEPIETEASTREPATAAEDLEEADAAAAGAEGEPSGPGIETDDEGVESPGRAPTASEAGRAGDESRRLDEVPGPDATAEDEGTGPADEEEVRYPTDPADFFEQFRTSRAGEAGHGRPPAGREHPSEAATGEPEAGAEAGPADRDRSLASALATEIEAGDADDEATRRLLDAIARKDRASTRVRLQRVESRQEEFGAYVDDLRELLDEHGPASAFVDDLRSSIEALELEAAALREEAAAAQDARASIREELSAELDAVRDRIATVEDDVEATADDVETLAEDLDLATDDLASSVSSLGEEVESLAEEVGAWEATRRRLLGALEVDEPGATEGSSPADRDEDGYGE